MWSEGEVKKRKEGESSHGRPFIFFFSDRFCLSESSHTTAHKVGLTLGTSLPSHFLHPQCLHTHFLSLPFLLELLFSHGPSRIVP